MNQQDKSELPQSCDYLVVGGGAAGCIVARRLADLPDTAVVLIEAGPDDEGDPVATDLSRLDDQDESYDWGYQATTGSRSTVSLAYSRARMLGGCANHNDCAFMPPAAGDLDRWEELGATGWNDASLAPALKRIEQSLNIEDSPEGTGLSKAFIDSASHLGLDSRNFREGIRPGSGWFPLNTDGNLRQSSSVAYLHPQALLPDSLTVCTNVQAQKLITTNGTITGVATNSGDINVRCEVILCAGSINTPQLMMLSGLGPGNELVELGIPVTVDLPGVGKNLIDHAAANVCCELHQPPPTWQRTPCEATALLQLESSARSPELLYHFVLRMREKYIGSTRFSNVAQGIKISPNVTRPLSRGSLRLTGPDSKSNPEINLNYFSDPGGQDMRTLIRGIRFGQLLAKTPPLSNWIRQEVLPGEVDDQDLEAYIRENCETVYHPCGTAKMGSPHDPLAVVTPDLKVRNIKNLRIADASVFPDIVTPNICNAVMMVAEQASDIIRNDHKKLD